MIIVRRGMSLIEVLVALPLIALLGFVSVKLLLTVQRDAIRLDGTLLASRELRHAAGILLADLRSARSEDLIAWSDTTVEFESTVGTGIVCANGPLRTFVAIAEQRADDRGLNSDPAPTEALWNGTPQPGDRAQLWYAGTTALSEELSTTVTLRSISGSSDCDQSPLRSPARRETSRLTFRDTLTGPVAIGAPVRFTRRSRYSLYRASDGDWFIGRRTLGPAGWDVVQPVAGPLAAARDRGLGLSVHDSSGTALASGTGRPLSLRVTLRAPRRVGRAGAGTGSMDSSSIAIALRASRSDAR